MKFITTYPLTVAIIISLLFATVVHNVLDTNNRTIDQLQPIIQSNVVLKAIVEEENCSIRLRAHYSLDEVTYIAFCYTDATTFRNPIIKSGTIKSSSVKEIFNTRHHIKINSLS